MISIAEMPSSTFSHVDLIAYSPSYASVVIANGYSLTALFHALTEKSPDSKSSVPLLYLCMPHTTSTALASFLLPAAASSVHVSIVPFEPLQSPNTK